MIEQDFDLFFEEEEVIYVNDGLQRSRDQDGYFSENEEYEYRMVKPPMANPNKDLAKMIDASENLPHHYKEYLPLGENICKFIPFKDYFYFIFGFDPKDVDEHSLNGRKSSVEEPSCSNYVSKEEERKSKREDASKTFVGPSIMRLFGFSFSRSSKIGDRSTIPENEF